jgi:hypothetical protein
MAIIPLNAFRNIAAKLTTTEALVYATPVGVSTVILSAVCANYTTTNVEVTFKIEKIVNIGGTPTIQQFYIVPGIEVIAKDVLSVIGGRLVLEEGDKIYAFAESNNAIDFVMSVNEAANE